MSKEEWREHESGLLVSNLGQVFIPKSGCNKEHYTYGNHVIGNHLRVKYKRKHYLVHDIEYRSFYPDTPKEYMIHHINGNGKDNRLENLMALTKEEHNKIHKSISVLQYDLEGNFIIEWTSTREIEKQLGYRSGNITKCLKGKYKFAYGFIWKYKE